jgi:HAD superfamily phosphatase (TIGR01668 family)
MWRTGQFDRKKIHGVFHPFTPAHAINTLQEIDLDQLWAQGKRLILVDVDNTLVQWKQESFSDPVLAWIAKAKEMGFGICLVSNTNKLQRLARLRELLGVETVRGRFKPSRAMFRLAMIKFKCKPEETIMIGDQLMTDILGANRAGIEAIWVRKMEGVEFGPTRINRTIERFFQSFIYRALVAPMDEESSAEERDLPIEETALFHQIVKFVLVGGTSFAIDYMIRMTLMFAVPWDGSHLSDVVGAWLRSDVSWLFGTADSDRDAFFPIAATIAASFAIGNTFIWNRLWTFGITGKHERMRQFQRFVQVSVIGLAMNVLLSTFFNHTLPFDEKWNARLATVFAAGIVAIWNFAGQRMYAFKSKQPG